MSSLFDDNDEQERQEQKLYEFYEVFSLEVRRQLLVKNIPIIQNVYDVLYPQTKNQLLSKNISTEFTIDSTAESIRNALVDKLVGDNVNLDTISENFRNQILSKNVLADSSRELQNKIDRVRKNLLDKNKNVNPNNIDSVADSQRRDALSKNKEALNRENEIQRDNISFRENNLSKNVPNENIGLDNQSDEFRKNNTHKNIESDIDLDRQNNTFRKQNLAKNTKENSPSNLDSVAEEKRAIEQGRNIPSQNDGLEVESESFRDSNLSKNESEETSLENLSTSIRENNLSKNDSVENDLLDRSSKLRKEGLSKNIESNTDLLNDSDKIREDDLSKNISTETDLLSSSEENRLTNLSKNNLTESDLLLDSNQIREDDLSKNNSTGGDLIVDSESFRSNNLSNNSPVTSDLVTDNSAFRDDNTSKNVPTDTDLAGDSEVFRADNVSKNTESESDLLNDSSLIRQDNISSNIPNTSDLLLGSDSFRDDNLSRTIPNITDLESISENPRTDLLSKNVSNPSDLLASGIVPREDLLSVNVPNITDLLNDSSPFRGDLLAINVPVETDLLTDSEGFRDNVLSDNVPNATDLLNDSIPYYANNISSNVPNPYDILSASEPYLQDNLSPNVPVNSDLLSDSEPYLQDNLSPNVPVNSDLLSDSESYLQDNLASNVPNDSDLLAESIPIRNDLVAQNQSNPSNLLNESTPFRDNLLAQNNNTQLGITFEGLGTFSYLGVSKVAIQGLVIRTFLKSKNRPNPLMSFDNNNGPAQLDNLLYKNDYVLYNSEYDRSNAIKLTDHIDARGLALAGYPNTYADEKLTGAIKRQFGVNRFYTEVYAENLQKKYGLQERSNDSYSLGGAYFGVNSLNAQGGEFTNSDKAGSTTVANPNYLGTTTDAIRGYNMSRNLYNLNGIQSVTSMPEYATALQANNDLGFQDLISKTIGAFSIPSNSISAQQFGNLIPNGVLGQGGSYQYLRDSAEKLFGRNEPVDPQLKMTWVGTAESMMQKTIAGNPLNEPAFDTSQRGIKHVMKTIRNNPNIKMSVNYDPQNTKKYVIKETQQGEPVYSRQKFTISNPYAPPTAQPLIFSLKNYSSGKSLYFPPYINDFSDSHSANWNEINFLGRPEPIYTYNNSKRDGSISFIVLTDYSLSVKLGTDWNSDDLKEIEQTFNKSFLSRSEFGLEISGLVAKYAQDKELGENLRQFEAAQNTSTAVATTGATNARLPGEGASQGAENNQGETAELESELESGDSSIFDTESIISNSLQALEESLGNPYVLQSKKSKNIYDFMTNKRSGPTSEIITTPGDTLERLDIMGQNTLFQPSFFSGSKEDFKKRMDFLAKLTKPAKASEGSGYSFTSPPVAHIKLGNWWDHDIVVKTVSVDYAESPWALDEVGKVQPLWAKVTLTFDFVGRYGGEGFPVLSTDSGGVYSK